MKVLVDVVHDRSVEIYHAKKQALEQGDGAAAQQIGEGKDLMSILSELSRIVTYVQPNATHTIVRANRDAAEEDKLPEDEVIAQIAYVLPRSRKPIFMD